MGGIQSITDKELITGVAEFASGCMKNGVGPSTYLQISNGEQTAAMDFVLYKKDPAFYWTFKSSRLQLNHKDSEAFIMGYNRKAAELGMTGFHIISPA